MNTEPHVDLADLLVRSQNGDLEACDQLATHLYSKSEYEKAAHLYLRAWQGDYYERRPNQESERRFFSMIDYNLLPSNSDAARYVRARRDLASDIRARANKAAGRAGIAAFIGYMILVFGGGITGFLRDFSLIIGAGLAWLAWYMVLSSFNRDA